MNWQFSIIDRLNIEHPIEEPVGWDATKIKIKRDAEKHGVFVDFQFNEFRFYAKAMTLIKAEYAEYGAEGKMRLRIGLSCENSAAITYTCRFVFKGYKETAGDDCFVTIGVEKDNDDAMVLFNRWDQAVDLQTNRGFDGVTELAPYGRLPFSMVLPSKGIKLSNNATEDGSTNGKVLGVDHIVSGGTPYNGEMGQVAFGMSATKTSELGFYMDNGISYQTIKRGPGAFAPPFDQENVFEVPVSGSQEIYIWPEGFSPIVNWSKGSEGFTGGSISPSISVRLKGHIKLLNAEANRIAGVIVKMDAFGGYQFLHIEEIYVDSPHLPKGTIVDFDFSYTNPALPIHAGDRIYGIITCSHFKTDADAEALLDAFEISFESGSYWNMEYLSYASPSAAKVFMVNEAWSRIAEAITDGKIRVYSEYFGRTDSQPYSHAQDGCGALEIITKGLFVRRQESRQGLPVVAALSLDDMWQGLNAIHNIGCGLEADAARPDHLVLRVEPYQYFYADDVLMECNHVGGIDRRCDEGRLYSIYKFGYQKWEAEEYNGLDEFLTKRTYRTKLSSVKNTIEKLSAFVASGYAWEVTRRKGDDTTKDWRYDSDTFVACIRRDSRTLSINLLGSFLSTSFFTETEPVGLLAGDVVEISGTALNAGTYTIESVLSFGTGGYGIYFATPVTLESDVTITISLINAGFTIEQGNILSPDHIIDPATAYNFRISPVRMALNWLSVLLASYKKVRPENALVFVDGEGNYFAAGELVADVCRREGVKLTENEALSHELFTIPSLAYPKLAAEEVSFTYPMSFSQFASILSNPRGRIAYNTYDGIAGSGWISEVTYRPNDGEADFVLIPKYVE